MKLSLPIFISLFLFLAPAGLMSNSFTIEAESMTLSGPYAGQVSNPFAGIALYANNDRGTITHNFPSGPGMYQFSIRGASNNSNAAGVTLYLNGTRIRVFTFYGTSPTILEAELKLDGLNTGSNTIALVLETDNGSSDTFIDRFTFTYLGPIVEKDPPVLPEQGAYYTGIYRNMLKEAGYSDAQISQKLNALWNQMFYGNTSNQTVYYPVGNDMAYILDTGNDDVRSEGMSYGMMICVQMDKQEEFNRLWKWTKTYMQHQSGARKGYFAWQVNTNGTIRDANSASDGEIYFVMALMFASGRWGDGEGIFNYWKEAKDILVTCMTKENPIQESITNLFNTNHMQVVFTPFANAATFTNPSYHLPAFYELWGKWVRRDRAVWKGLAAKSREMFPVFAHPQTGLMPDYANFDGTPTGGHHAQFRYDAWRCIMNVAMDYAWFKAEESQVELVNRIHNFFQSKGIESYGSEFTLAGSQLNSDHSPGLVACNAAGAMASNQRVAWEFIDDFFKIAIPTGRYRYYDGLLYFMNYLHLSGNFRIYTPASIELDDEPEPDPDPVHGYHIIESFNNRELGSTYDMLKQHGGSTGNAVITLSPTDNDERVAQVITGNWDEYIRFSVNLPAGKQIADYVSLEFDIFYNSNAANSDNSFKDMRVFIANNQVLNQATGNSSGTNHNKWLNISVPVSHLSTGNSFTIHLGVRSNKANYFVNNVRLKDTTSMVENIKHYTEWIQVSKNNLRVLNNEVADFHFYDLSGKQLMSIKNETYADFENLAQGVYIVRVLQGSKTETIKLIK